MSRVIATRDKSFSRYWYVTVDTDCKGSVDRSEVAALIATILTDSKGWRSHGYEFIQLSHLSGSAMRKDRNNWNRVFHIRVSLDRTISHECGFSGLSCADMSINVIYINLDRWLHGASASGLALLPYRYYLVQHEIGHLLGRHHVACDCDSVTNECIRPIMVQATVAKDSCSPNMWPLANE